MGSSAIEHRGNFGSSPEGGQTEIFKHSFDGNILIIVSVKINS